MRLLLALCGLLLLTGCAAPPAAAPPAEPAAAPTRPAVADPSTVRIPALAIDTTLTPLGTDPDGRPAVPPIDQPGTAAWSTWTPRPGEPGAATLIGHVSGTDGTRGPPVDGVFHNLTELAPGDGIAVTDQNGTLRWFEVTKLEQFPKTLLPVEAIWGDVTGPELRLITCGGAYDPTGRRFLDQTVVYADAR